MTQFEKLYTSREKLVKTVLTLRGKINSSGNGGEGYVKPEGGIPKEDLSSEVRTSLGKADSAYSKPTDGIPSSDLASGVQASLALANSALQSHQDISGKQDKLVYEEITSTSSAALVLEKDYYVSSAIATFAFTLADNPSNGELSVIFTTGASPAITITSDATIYTQEGFSIDANSTYEMNIKALNGSYYIVLVKMEAV